MTQLDDVTTSLHLQAYLAEVSSNGTYDSNMFYYDYLTFIGSGNYEIKLTEFFITLDLNLQLRGYIKQHTPK